MGFNFCILEEEEEAEAASTCRSMLPSWRQAADSTRRGELGTLAGSSLEERVSLEFGCSRRLWAVAIRLP